MARKVTTPRYFPASNTQRRGWRTSSWRNVPRLYSLAIWAAAIPKATIPSRMVARLSPWMSPLGWPSWARLGSPPPLPVLGAWVKSSTVNSEAAAASPM